MAEEPAFEEGVPPVRIDNKRKHEDSEEQNRKSAFSPPPAGDRVRKTGFSGPPPEYQHERKTGFLGPPSEQYERRTGFSGPPPESYEGNRDFPASYDSERKTCFSGPPSSDFERKTGFSGPPTGDTERKSGFSGPHVNDSGKTGSSDYERNTGFSGPDSDVDRKTGFSGPSGDQLHRKTGFSGPPSESFNNSGPSSGLSSVEIAKQRAEQIVARFVAQDIKKSRTEDDDNQFVGKYESSATGYGREDYDGGRMFQSHTQVQHHNQNQTGGSYGMQGHFGSTKMDIPNARVGVVIGKCGETIKNIQASSGARIQITRDTEHDPQIPYRQVEIMGTPDQISRAEQMIKDVIAEADSGGQGHISGGGYGGSGSFGEPVQIRVPTNKVGLIIGRGGETIKSLQSQSGARIQLVAAATPDYSNERVITLVGTKQQTDMANDLIQEVISENRQRGPPGGYNQQGFRPQGPPQWGQSRGSPQSQGYGYQQQGSYPGPSQQYQSQPYGGYAQQPPMRPPQPPPQSYGYPQHPSGPVQDYSGKSQSYGENAARTTASGQQQQAPSQGFQQGVSPTDGSSGYSQPQGGYGQPSPYGQHGYGQQGSAIQSPGQYTATPSPYGPNQQHSHGQAAPGFGQPPMQPQAYPQQGYAVQGAQPSDQIPSTQTGYPVTGSGAQPQMQQGANLGQQQALSQLGYGQQVSGYGSQGGPQSGYGQQAGSFQAGYPSQGVQQQGTPGQSSYGQKGLSQPGYGSSETGYGVGAVQTGYGGVQSGYSTQVPPQSSYSQQVSMQPSYGPQASYGSPTSVAPAYGTSQQQSGAMGYSTQGSMQPSGYAHGGMPATSAYDHQSQQQGSLATSHHGYGHQLHGSSGDPPAHASNGGTNGSSGA